MDFFLTKTRGGECGAIERRTGILLSAVIDEIRQWVEAGIYQRVEVRDTYGNLVAHWLRIRRSETAQRAWH